MIAGAFDVHHIDAPAERDSRGMGFEAMAKPAPPMKPWVPEQP